MRFGAGAILVAAGRGERLGGEVPKQFLPLGGQPLFLHALAVLAASAEIGGTVLVVPAGWERRAAEAVAAAALTPAVAAVVAGGARRQDSVRLGLQTLPAVTHVLVHDAARPFLSAALVARTLAAARRAGAATAALPVAETLMRAAAEASAAAIAREPPGAGAAAAASSPSLAVANVDRTGVWAVQTPQVFDVELLRAAHAAAAAEGFEANDDGTLVLRLGRKLEFVPGEWWNLKVTGPEDLERAQCIWRARAQGWLDGGEGAAR